MPRPSNDDIAAHADWLRRLAASLVRDADAAEDLAQDAWLTALRHPPAQPRSWRSWLARVLRNRAVNLGRRESLRRRVEPRAARGEAAEEEDAAERLALMRSLLDGVEALEEPYRSTVLACFFEDERPHTVARRLGIPASTVRSRLSRGLEQLRRRLDGEHTGGRRAWVLALSPLAGARADAATALTEPIRGVTKLGMGSGTKAGLAIGVATAMVALVVWAPWAADEPRDAEVGGVPPVAHRAPLVHRVTQSAKGAGRPGPERASAGDDPAAPALPEPEGGIDRKLVVHLAGGSFSRDDHIRIRVRGLSRRGHTVGVTFRDNVLPGQRVVVDLTTLLTPNEWMPSRRQPYPRREAIDELSVTVEHPGFLRREVRVPTPQLADSIPDRVRLECTVPLHPAAALTGTVVRPDGSPLHRCVTGAFTMRGGVPRRLPIDEMRTERDGSFRLRLDPSQPTLVVAAASGHRPCFRVLPPPASSVPTPWLVRLDDGGPAIEGHAALTGFEPRDLQVTGRLDAGQPLELEKAALRWIDGRVEHAWAECSLRDDATFRLAGLAPCEHAVSLRVRNRRDDASLRCLPRTIAAPARGVELGGRAAWLSLGVEHGGEPVRSAYVDVEGPGIRRSTTLESGSGSFVVAPGETYLIRAWQRGIGETERRVIAPSDGETLDVLMTLAQQPRPALEVKVVTAEGRPVKRCGLGFFREGEDEPLRTTDAETSEGRLRYRFLPPGRYRLVARPGGWRAGYTHAAAGEASFELTGDETRRVTITCAPAGRLTVTARGVDGTPVPARFELVDADGRRVQREVFALREKGGVVSSFDDPSRLVAGAPSTFHPALPPGRYSLRLAHDEYRRVERSVVVTTGRTTTLELRLQLR